MPTASPACASRFVQRWLAAAPERAAQLDDLATVCLADVDFTVLLERELGQGVPPERAMRRVRNLLVATIIARDLGRQASLDEVVTAMTHFADFAIQTHVASLMAELVTAHGMPTGEESGRPQHMIVLAMGKQGGGELNVSSDIDLIFVYPEDGETAAGPGQRELSNHEFFVRLGRRLSAVLSEVIEDGFTFRVDMALRPNGKSGPLAASLGMVEEYLIVQGREWERYAWVKARAVTGEPDDIAALDAIVRPFVFRRYLDFGVIDAIRTMHAQIRAEVKRQERLHPERSHNVKLGRGGIREIEFLAQVFQLIRGGRDPALRERSTRKTLTLLAERELLTPDTVERLLEAYTFLRNLEHRVQYLEDAQTHTLPANPDDRQTVAAMMGYADEAELLARLDEQRTFVAQQFDAIFADKETPDQDPDAPALADDLDNLDALTGRLTALGYDDARAAATRLTTTLQGARLASLPDFSRVRLLALVDAALPQIATVVREAGVGSYAATLGRLLDLFEAIARRSAYLALLTEYPHTLERVIRMINASGWAATFLTMHPILLDELLDDRNAGAEALPQLAAALDVQLTEAEGDTERQLDILRETHHAQLFRLLALDLAGELSVEHLADHLSALADTIVGATVTHAWRTVNGRHRDPPRFAVIAYGKLGGKELGYVSDLDVIFLYDDDDGDAPPLYAKLAQRFITWMTAPTPAGVLFDIDIALRPDGASGMLVSSVAAFERYQTSAAWIWEHQALTRARFCAGDAAIGARFETIREQVLRKDRSSPAQEAALKDEVVKMRARMRGANPNRSTQFDLKQDAGGMIDIEFIVQYLVLRHAANCPQLTANAGNIALLRVCGELGLIDPALAAQVADAYRALRRLQHSVRLQGHDKTRVEPHLVGAHPDSVLQLWRACFGT